ncbi:MAG: phosphoribosylformylglycinamidine cyclo-ligase, partial [Clostridiales bacterium]|nr:phosphoribosylformylglycinamidine cyclo-ligase [Clostridiales bacterium]
NSVLPVCDVRGIVHVTGGGFYENIPRIIPDGLGAEINLGSWEVSDIFKYIQKQGNIETDEMFSTFNMGIGLIMATAENEADKILNNVQDARVIGKVVKGKGVRLCQR